MLSSIQGATNRLYSFSHSPIMARLSIAAAIAITIVAVVILYKGMPGAWRLSAALALIMAASILFDLSLWRAARR